MAVEGLTCLWTYRSVAEEHDAVFRADKTYNLIVRLRHNVIRTGLRRINLAYSRISLSDVAKKLGGLQFPSSELTSIPDLLMIASVSAGLLSVEDTESILGKAIRDGGIEAVIDHEHSWMTSKDTVDVYATSVPQSAFHARVAFCLDIHNEVCCISFN